MADPIQWPITLDFGQIFGSEVERGIDFGTPVGTPIYAPAAGTIGTEDLGKKDSGKRIFVHAQDGLTYAVGHLSAFAAPSGSRVNAGDLIGYSGGATSDPSSGVSTGPHVEVQVLDAAGRYLNPHNFTDVLGAVFNALPGGAALGSAAGGHVPTLPNPLDALTGALNALTQLWQKEFWIGIGLAVITIGGLLVIFEDLEKDAKAAASVAAENPELLAAAA